MNINSTSTGKGIITSLRSTPLKIAVAAIAILFSFYTFPSLYAIIITSLILIPAISTPVSIIHVYTARQFTPEIVRINVVSKEHVNNKLS